MPRSHRLIFGCAVCAAFGFPLRITAAETARIPVAESGRLDSQSTAMLRLAEQRQFDELNALLQSEANHKSNTAERVAVILFAAQQAYAAQRRDLAEQWLAPCSAAAPASLRRPLADALTWCRIDAADLALPTQSLLERAEKSHSAFAALALEQRAASLVEQQRLDEAVQLDHEIVKLFPAAPSAPRTMLHAAKLHQQLGQHRETVAWCERLLREHTAASEGDGALYLLSASATRLGDAKTAAQAMEKLVTDRQASTYWPDAAYRHAEQLRKQSRSKEALELLARVIADDRASPNLKAHSYYLQAQIAMTERDWKSAEAALENLLAMKPDSGLVLSATLAWAETAYQRGDHAVAEERFQTVENLAADASASWLGVVPLRLAQLAARRQDWVTVIDHTESVVRLYPDYPQKIDAQYLRARALVASARFREAREQLGQIVSSKTATPSETVAMSQWLTGETYFLQRQYEPALAAYDKVLNFPAFPQWQAAALLQSAKCCEQLGRRAEAAARYQRIVREFSETRYVAEAQRRMNTEDPAATATR